jgi:adenylate cyclase
MRRHPTVRHDIADVASFGRANCYDLPMIAEEQLNELVAWIADAGLAGQSELMLVTGFCERAAAAGLPLSRAHLLIDTLDPVHEGRVFRWGFDASLPPEQDYGRTSSVGGTASGLALAPSAQHVDAWLSSPFYRMRETGESLLRRRLTAADETEFKVLLEMRAAGFTDYVAIINRFAAEGIIGEMDCVYSSWATRDPEGFQGEHIAGLQRLVPFLALAVKSAALTRMTGTLMQTYLGRDAGRRVLSGRIVRGVADRIDTVLWFSDLRGFTRITDMTPEHVIPLLNDYADVIVSAIHEQGGDVLKFMGDGALAIFTADDRSCACNAALTAAVAARQGVAELNERRSARGLPTTDMYLGLHVGEVLYGNIGSRERLDFTVVGPAVNEVSRIAAMCRSAEQPMLVSAAFAEIGNNKARLVSVGRYALRGVSGAQELFTLEPNDTAAAAPIATAASVRRGSA